MKELTHQEINKAMASLAGDAEVIQFTGINWGPDPINYCEDLNEALIAARRISDKTGYTFVMTYDGQKGEYTASFGDYGDCAEYKGSNPAYCICMVILKFMGKM